MYSTQIPDSGFEKEKKKKKRGNLYVWINMITIFQKFHKYAYSINWANDKLGYIFIM